MNPKKCKIENCEDQIRCKELCHRHYNRANARIHRDKIDAYDRSPKRRYDKFIAYCKREGKPTDLNYTDWYNLIKNNKCDYCGEKLPVYGHGLDRMYYHIGYFKINVVPCCEKCNRTKNNMYTYEEFKVMITALIKYKNERKRIQKII